MKTCPSCGGVYPINSPDACPVDGARLLASTAYAATRSSALLGATLAERYEIVGRVGTGGMGTVYRARQVGLAREVALKVLRPETAADHETVARFEHEAKAMSLLLHSNTVRVIDFGEDPSGYLYLAMELLEGESLAARIEREGALGVRDAIRIAQQILRSLAEAHGKGLVHRDLKPDNVFLARIAGHREPVVKVLDFGIAKVFRPDAPLTGPLETQAGTVYGTPRYMSPEQVQGKALDPRSDLYAVGVLLYQMLVGRPPFVDSDAVVVMAQHIREVPTPPCAAAPERPIPRSLERAILRALAKSPRARPADAEEMERELIACLPDVEREEALAAGGLRSDDVVLALGRTVSKRTAKIGTAALAVSMLAASLALASGGWVAPPSAVVSERSVVDSGATTVAPMERAPSTAAPSPTGEVVTIEPPPAAAHAEPARPRAARVRAHAPRRRARVRGYERFDY
jgi:serine/threonine-protein kinase